MILSLSGMLQHRKVVNEMIVFFVSSEVLALVLVLILALLVRFGMAIQPIVPVAMWVITILEIAVSVMFLVVAVRKKRILPAILSAISSVPYVLFTRGFFESLMTTGGGIGGILIFLFELALMFFLWGLLTAFWFQTNAGACMTMEEDTDANKNLLSGFLKEIVLVGLLTWICLR